MQTRAIPWCRCPTGCSGCPATEYADALEHDLGIPAGADDAPAMVAAWAAIESARGALRQEAP